MRPLLTSKDGALSSNRLQIEISNLTKQVSNLENKRIGLTTAITSRKNTLNRLKAQLAMCESGSTLA